MKISFHGASQGVTGSCHLLECGNKKILIDCGMYQGEGELEIDNASSFGFNEKEIDYLLLTHAHLDHCGRIPLIAKRGFKGEVICTRATAELARLIMMDAAYLQEEDTRYEIRKAQRRGKNTDEIEPLYNRLDAMNSLEFFGRKAEYNVPMQLAPGIQATFIDAGHILGSASVLLELEDQGKRHRIIFSGDLGYSDRAILRDPTPPPQVDTVVMETTYGNRLHKALQPSIDELYSVINDTVKRGGNVIIPTFALERAQEVLFYLREGANAGKIDRRINIFLDSPMAISATRIFERHPECYDEKTLKLLQDGEDIFRPPGLRFTSETAESMAINRISGGAVIMAGSGMCTGGRVRHHLKHNLWRKDCSVIFVGFAARGTLARRIIDGAKTVRVLGDEITVKARIHTIGGFSAHADQAELLKWHTHAGKPAKTFLVHGEKDTMHEFARHLKHTRVEIPALHQSYKL
ncbi:MAG: MBL fold metallo-hydrolase [Gammaproteobacteria bacterium]